MWTIRLLDGTAYLIYLREYMLEGGILCFEQEELALRFMKLVSDAVTKTLSVRVTVARYEGDTRKDYFTKVTTGNWKSYIDTIRQFGK